MEVGLSSAEESYNDQPLDSLENALIRYADDKHMTALLHNLKKYLNENKDNFTKETNPIIRDTRSNQQGNISSSKEAVVAYIKNLWVEVQSRLKYSDCTDGATSFSEAPAESIFSYYERIHEGRESLSLDRSNSLVRIALEGPTAATEMAKELSKESLKRHKSHLGERFTTANWRPPMISKTIIQIQEGKPAV